jgi:hypothetical protein
MKTSPAEIKIFVKTWTKNRKYRCALQFASFAATLNFPESALPSEMLSDS